MTPDVDLLKRLLDDNGRDLKLTGRYSSEVTQRQAQLSLIQERKLLKEQYFKLTGIQDLDEATPTPATAQPKPEGDGPQKEPVHA
jgi:hypothetical protein